MSDRYPGGFITKTPVVPTPSSASGVWTLDQQLQAQKSGTWPFGGPFTYIEDVFSTYLYTGNGSAPTITNGIDLSTYGGLIWTKDRTAAEPHFLMSPVQNDAYLSSNTTAGYTSSSSYNVTYNTNGFTLPNNFRWTTSPDNYTTWTFRKQPKFFDVVTYTGNASTQTISHNLGAVPGCIIVKAVSGTSSTSDWAVYHRGITDAKNNAAYLNTFAASFSTSIWNNADPTATTFQVYGDAYPVNNTGTTYVAYLFAHNAGGFGLTGTDNVITCGSYTGNGSSAGPVVTLGYEPQWLMIKNTSQAYQWYMLDTMRGFTVGSDVWLQANVNSAEVNASSTLATPTATGFQIDNSGAGVNASGNTYIYIAIRRGPMKTPTSGTSVFSPNAVTGSGYVSSGFPVDKGLTFSRAGGNNWYLFDRLRGSGDYGSYVSKYLSTNNTGPESSQTGYGLGFDDNVGYSQNWWTSENAIYYNFRRAPGFFDEVCWSGDGTSGRYIDHNLTVAPELIILKNRTTFSYQWSVYEKDVFNVGGKYELVLNSDSAQYDAGSTNTPFSTATAPSATQFRLGSGSACNSASSTYVAYLFATCAGVSKVGKYTGTGTTKQIDCGFTGGARFVLIKRTDSTGDWYVWDSARGIVAGNDPYLLLNSTAAEVTNTDYVDTYNAGFEISSTAPAAINANGGTYIFLAIA